MPAPQVTTVSPLNQPPQLRTHAPIHTMNEPHRSRYVDMRAAAPPAIVEAITRFSLLRPCSTLASSSAVCGASVCVCVCST